MRVVADWLCPGLHLANVQLLCHIMFLFVCEYWKIYDRTVAYLALSGTQFVIFSEIYRSVICVFEMQQQQCGLSQANRNAVHYFSLLLSMPRFSCMFTILLGLKEII